MSMINVISIIIIIIIISLMIIAIIIAPLNCSTVLMHFYINMIASSAPRCILCFERGRNQRQGFVLFIVKWIL